MGMKNEALRAVIRNLETMLPNSKLIEDARMELADLEEKAEEQQEKKPLTRLELCALMEAESRSVVAFVEAKSREDLAPGWNVLKAWAQERVAFWAARAKGEER